MQYFINFFTQFCTTLHPKFLHMFHMCCLRQLVSFQAFFTLPQMQEPLIQGIPYNEVPYTGFSYIGLLVYIYIYIYILEARERAKSHSLLDPSDPSDAKAFSLPISAF